MVEKQGIIIVKAGGNDGPIHSSIYEMERFQNLILNIGSCLTPEMKKFLYKIHSKNSPIVSSFSSQGPMPKSGGCGVTLVAPGHGVVDMPRHYSFKTRLFAATSFSCPNAVGAIACLISGLKANSTPVTFFKIKLALINTAFLPDNGSKLAFGNGIIQTKDAFEFYLNNLQDFPTQITNTVISVFNKNKNLLRVNWHLELSSNAKNFITNMLAVDRNNGFSIKIDVANLSQNSMNYAEIVGYDSSNPSWGPLFYLPITVMIPRNFYEMEKISEIIELNSTLPYRIFFFTSKKIDECFIRLQCLQQTRKTSVQIQYFAGDTTVYVDDTKTMKFTKGAQLQTCNFLMEETNKIHEICVIIDDYKSLKNLKFQFELSFQPFFMSAPYFSRNDDFFLRNDKKGGENYKDAKISLALKDASSNLDYESSCSTTNEKNSVDQFSIVDATDLSVAQTSNNSEITYELFTQKIRLKNIEEKIYFVTTYYYFSRFIDARTCNIQLLPGTYVIKGIFEYNNDKNFPMFFPFRLPLITLTLGSHEVLRATACINFILSKEMINEYKNSINAYFNRYWRCSLNNAKIFLNINSSDLELCHSKIQEYYFTEDNQNLHHAVDASCMSSKQKNS